MRVLMCASCRRPLTQDEDATWYCRHCYRLTMTDNADKVTDMTLQDTPIEGEGRREVNLIEGDELSLGMTEDESQVIVAVVAGENHIGVKATTDTARAIGAALIEIADDIDAKGNPLDCEMGSGNE